MSTPNPSSSRFSIVQRTLDRPDVERLKRAFRSVSCLTPADAMGMANDAFGILVASLPANEAMVLQRALAAEGIDTAVVLVADLPVLPPVKRVRRLDCLPDGLVSYDPLGRPVRLDWGHVEVIAAGTFRQERLQRVVTSHDVTRAGPFGMTFEDTITDVSHVVRRASAFAVELVLGRGAMRFEIDGDEFQAHYLGDRRKRDSWDNLVLAVQDLAKFAPHASLNLGAAHLQLKAGEILSYPGRKAFHEEITWLLWKRAEIAASGAAPQTDG